MGSHLIFWLLYHQLADMSSLKDSFFVHLSSSFSINSHSWSWCLFCAIVFHVHVLAIPMIKQSQLLITSSVLLAKSLTVLSVYTSFPIGRSLRLITLFATSLSDLLPHDLVYPLLLLFTIRLSSICLVILILVLILPVILLCKILFQTDRWKWQVI